MRGIAAYCHILLSSPPALIRRACACLRAARFYVCRFVYFWQIVEFFDKRHNRHGDVTEICDSCRARTDGAGA
jgi:hypothetical protein